MAKPAGNRLQFSLKKGGNRLVHANGVGMAQKVMGIVHDDHRFQIDSLPFEPLYQISALAKAHVPVVVAMDDEHGGSPGIGIGNRGGFPGYL